jgi:putative tryptophan/tyrosine transport system substrate-binding protein
MTATIARRQFIAGLGGAAAWPLAAGAQQRAMPVIGYLHLGSPRPDELGAFHKGLSELGYVEGRDVAVEYRWANNENSRLPELVADLIRRRVAVISAFGVSAALRAKSATTTIPVVFLAGADAVQVGLVRSLSRPGGNITGINSMNAGLGLGAKRLGLLHELLPQAMRFGILVALPSLPSSVTVQLDLDEQLPAFQSIIEEVQVAAAALGRPLEVLPANTSREIEAVFATLTQKRVDALMVTPSYLFDDRRVQLAMSAVRYAMPTIFPERRDAEFGGLMSYGPNWVDLNRQTGVYVGRILKGEKPADLPVLQPTKFEFVINTQTARLIGLDVPPILLALADEVIQ